MVGPVAEAGIYYAMLRLIANDPKTQWRSDGSVYELPFSGARVRVRSHDEAGKFDLNTVPDTVLINLMENIGLSYEDAAALVDVIIDWRDSDDFRRVNGAEEAEYRDAGLDYGPRNKDFQSMQELRLVLGVSRDLYRKLEPMVTVYNGSKGIDPTKSPREVLYALPGITDNIIETYLEDRAASADNSLPPPVFPVSVENMEFTNANGTTFSIESEARFPDGRQATISAVIKKSNGDRMPFEFLEWNTRFPGENSLFDESVIVVGQTDSDN